MIFKAAQPAFANGIFCFLLACPPAFLSISAEAQTALPPGHPDMQQPSAQSVAAEGVRTSANIARGAADVCHIDTTRLARFKAVTQKSYPEAPDFEGEWKLGYTEAQSMVDRMAALSKSNPPEYAKEVGEACPALNKGIDEATQ